MGHLVFTNAGLWAEVKRRIYELKVAPSILRPGLIEIDFYSKVKTMQKNLWKALRKIL
jgi:hypothetical protein